MEQIINDLQVQMGTYYEYFIAFLPKLALAIILLLVYVFIAGWLRRRSSSYFRSKLEDDTLINFFDKMLKVINVIIAVMIFLLVIGKSGLASSLLGATSLSAIVIGFAFKDIAENFLAGIIMAFKRRYSIGDTIKTGDVEGNIVALNLRDTHVKTFDGKDVYVPNGTILKQPLYNYTIDGYLRHELTVSLKGNSDIQKALTTIKSSLAKDTDVMAELKSPNVFVTDVNGTRINIKAQYWLDLNHISKGGLAVKTEAYDRIIADLAKEDIHLQNEAFFK